MTTIVSVRRDGHVAIGGDGHIEEGHIPCPDAPVWLSAQRDCLVDAAELVCMSRPAQQCVGIVVTRVEEHRHDDDYGLAGNDIDQLVGDNDDFADCLAIEFGDNLWKCHRCGFRGCIVSPGWKCQLVAELSVDLNDDCYFILCGDFRIRQRPGPGSGGRRGGVAWWQPGPALQIVTGDSRSESRTRLRLSARKCSRDP